MKTRFYAYLQMIMYYFLFGLIFLGLIIIYGVSKASKFNDTFFLLGLGLMFVPGLILYFLFRSSEKTERSDYTKKVRDLKNNGEAILVAFAECKVISNSWVQEKERYANSRVVFLNSISGHSDKNILKENVHFSSITYNYKAKGRSRTFKSGTIAKDHETLQMLLELKGQTYIYVDKKNPKRYYFDLQFLTNEQ